MDAALVERLRKTETERVEWKESLRDGDAILRAACALANDLSGNGEPGFVVVGVDKSGRVVGVDERGQSLDEEQKRLSNRLRSTRILPTPSTAIVLAKAGDRLLVVITVDSYDAPLVVTVDGRAWVRVGSTTRQATDADLARIRERRPDSMLPFDSRGARGATLDDLDVSRLRDEYRLERDADDRTPLITTLLVETGHVQQLGRGVRLARAELEKNGNLPLEVETDGFTRVIVRAKR